MGQVHEQLAVQVSPLYFDNTKVTSYNQCPRQFYYRHVRHWTKEGKKDALAFGSGWHAALDVVWALAASVYTDQEIVEAAYIAFCQSWVKDGFEINPTVIQMDQLRNPGLAKDMLAEYLVKFRDQLREFEILSIEQPFAVPLIVANAVHPGSQPILYIGRWDKVYRDNKRILVREHKTTSIYRKDGNFSSEFVQSFSPNSQVDGYSYAALGVYGSDFKGVIVEGALVHKSVRAFLPIPVQRSYQNLESWAFDVTYWISEIMDNMQNLKTGGIEDLPYLPAFPKRTEHCQHKYGMCGYLELCKYAPANPMTMACPDGYLESPWDPFAHNVEEGQQLAVIGSGGIQQTPITESTAPEDTVPHD